MRATLRYQMMKLERHHLMRLSCNLFDFFHRPIYDGCEQRDSFLARDSIYAIARYMPSPVRLSVCLAVRHTGGSVKDV